MLPSCVHSVAEGLVVFPAQRHSTLRRCRTVAAVAAASGTMATSGSGGKQVLQGLREMHLNILRNTSYKRLVRLVVDPVRLHFIQWAGHALSP